jgi:hypothetical protein
MKTSKKSTSAFACLFVGIALSLSTTKTVAQTIPTDSVMNYIGKTVKVCDKVYGTHVSKGEKKVTSLNLGADFPHQKMSIVIFENALPKFSYKPEIFLKDKNVCVTGKVMTYKDKPQIIVNEPAELTYE